LSLHGLSKNKIGSATRLARATPPENGIAKAPTAEVGLAAFAGPIGLGALWQAHGAPAAFHAAAAAAALAAALLPFVGRARA
jgi:hypothetical protein